MSKRSKKAATPAARANGGQHPDGPEAEAAPVAAAALAGMQQVPAPAQPPVRKFTGNIYIEVRDNTIRYKVESLGKPTFGDIKNVFVECAKHQDARLGQQVEALGAHLYVEDPVMWKDEQGTTVPPSPPPPAAAAQK